MRTNIVIDDNLIREAMRLTDVRTKKQAVDLALRTLVHLRKQAAIRGARGKLHWRGDLERMRRDT